MRFAALLGVMDEVDLLPRCLAHLRRIGVCHVLAMDGGSTDGSREWLRTMRGEALSVLELTEEEQEDPEQCSLREAEAARALDADWILFLDVDEFWLPAGGTLHQLAQWADPEVDVLEVPRFNIALPASGELVPDVLTPDGYGDLWMFARPIPDFRRHLEAHPSIPWITGVPVPKVAARRSRIGRMAAGWHGLLDAAGAPLARQRARGLVTAHLPFTTLDRFRRKVANIRRLFDDGATGGFAPGQAWHWRRWATLSTPEAVDVEFARQCLTPDEFAALRADGGILSAQQLLQDSA